MKSFTRLVGAAIFITIYALAGTTHAFEPDLLGSIATVSNVTILASEGYKKELTDDPGGLKYRGLAFVQNPLPVADVEVIIELGPLVAPLIAHVRAGQFAAFIVPMGATTIELRLQNTRGKPKGRTSASVVGFAVGDLITPVR